MTNPYRYSYSGADAKVYARFPGYESQMVHLESIHTISVSVHEAKGQARALGHRGVKGISRGVRTIAGSMILTVIEDHPFRQLMIQAAEVANGYRGGWSMDQNMIGVGDAYRLNFNNRLVELLPPMDILIVYVSEGGQFSVTAPTSGTGDSTLEYQGAAMLVKGVDIVDSGMITSVNDIVSEITMSFIARDFRPIYLNTLNTSTPTPGDFETRLNGSNAQNHAVLEKMLFEDFKMPTVPSGTEAGDFPGFGGATLFEPLFPQGNIG